MTCYYEYVMYKFSKSIKQGFVCFWQSKLVYVLLQYFLFNHRLLWKLNTIEHGENYLQIHKWQQYFIFLFLWQLNSLIIFFSFQNFDRLEVKLKHTIRCVYKKKNSTLVFTVLYIWFLAYLTRNIYFNVYIIFSVYCNWIFIFTCV